VKSDSDWITDILPKVRECIKTRKYRITNHAQERQEQHQITLPDLLFVLSNGFHEQEKTLFDTTFQAWKYAIRGRSIDSSLELRVIVAFEDEMAILTIIRLNKKKRKK
jgi:hypothetical protein